MARPINWFASHHIFRLSCPSQFPLSPYLTLPAAVRRSVDCAGARVISAIPRSLSDIRRDIAPVFSAPCCRRISESLPMLVANRIFWAWSVATSKVTALATVGEFGALVGQLINRQHLYVLQQDIGNVLRGTIWPGHRANKHNINSISGQHKASNAPNVVNPDGNSPLAFIKKRGERGALTGTGDLGLQNGFILPNWSSTARRPSFSNWSRVAKAPSGSCAAAHGTSVMLSRLRVMPKVSGALATTIVPVGTGLTVACA